MMALPKGYIRVEHIESSGTQYVNTGVHITNKLRIEIDVSDWSTTEVSTSLFGGIDSSAGRFELFVPSAGGYYRFYYGGTYVNSNTDVSCVSRTTVIQDSNRISIGGATLEIAASEFAMTQPLFLFAYNSNGSPTRRSSLRIHGCRIYNDGVLLRDYVPCVNPSGEAGLYDLVNDVFYGNAGSGAFTVGKYVLTRDEIIPLEYIESNGAQYVDTGFKPNNNTRVVMDAQLTSISGTAFYFGARASGYVDSFAVLYSGSAKAMRSAYGSENLTFATTNYTDRVQIDKNKTSCKRGTETLSHTASTFQNTFNLYLFASNEFGTVGSRALMRLYSCQIYDNSVIVRDYIPAKLANGAVGLWNSLDGVFYTDAAGGSFIAGPEIQIGPEAPAELAYTVSGDRISLSWSASEGADGYRVYMDGARVLETTETAAELPFPFFTAATFGVSAYNADGESAQTTAAAANYPENPILYLVTDRTAADVERVKRLAAKGYASMTEAERNEWNAGLKGAYNASDLNRVQAAMAYLADRLNALGYYAEAPHQRMWTASDMPKPSDMAAYLSDVEKLRAVIPVMPTTPDVPPDMEKPTYSEANDIEKILLDINTLLNNMTAAWFYSGEIYSGEV